MDDNGIAWLMAGGVRAQSAEDQRQRFQRVKLAHHAPTADRSILLPIRRAIAAARIAAIREGRSIEQADPSRLVGDCCLA